MLLSILVVSLALTVSGSPKNSSLSNRDDWIIGGEDATIEEFPHQVAYLSYEGGSPTCGGSLLSESLVVTAAHCAIHKNPNVRVGTNKRDTDEGQIAKIKTFIVHEDYGKVNPHNNDIALLVLETPLKLGDGVQPIRLPEQDQATAAGTEVLLSGWGTMIQGERQVPAVLQKVKVPIIEQNDCKNLYSDKLISEGMLCAGFVETGGKDACQGDSGGPLVEDSVLLGITSWGYGCAKPNRPGVYTRVAKYVDWIREQNKLQGLPDIP